ncbi:hypothetical protein PROFUN_10700 [Planoprotostelium fungivorum]|uniref:LisH domain-containing protein n=1 Tax=Planoprotostelium fungivorum TaxID=1890364 RepID=A0A2P6N9M1_9EUKA|nr:hypothetical protein PROFUN_10700 [Planoprotostelium fungivorum]
MSGQSVNQLIRQIERLKLDLGHAQDKRKEIQDAAVDLLSHVAECVKDKTVPTKKMLNKFTELITSLVDEDEPVEQSRGTTPIARSISAQPQSLGNLSVPIKKSLSVPSSRNPSAIQPIRKSSSRSPEIDWSRIKEEMVNVKGPSTKRGLLIQALRQRLTQPKNEAGRKQVASSFVQFDVLSLRNTRMSLPYAILSGNEKSEFVRQQAAGLINLIASHHAGRSYLMTKGDEIITLLHRTVTTIQNDTAEKQQALSSIQKLSLRRRAQDKMISLEMIPWLVRFLGQSSQTGEYTLEYASALLMNLSLRNDGKRQCEAQKNIVQVLGKLMRHDNTKIRTFVHGTLYSIFAVPSLKEVALRIKFDHILEREIEEGPEEFQTQIEHILNKLRSDDEVFKSYTAADNVYEDENDSGDSGTLDDEPDEPMQLPEVSRPVLGKLEPKRPAARAEVPTPSSAEEEIPVSRGAYTFSGSTNFDDVDPFNTKAKIASSIDMSSKPGNFDAHNRAESQKTLDAASNIARYDTHEHMKFACLFLLFLLSVSTAGIIQSPSKGITLLTSQTYSFTYHSSSDRHGVLYIAELDDVTISDGSMFGGVVSFNYTIPPNQETGPTNLTIVEKWPGSQLTERNEFSTATYYILNQEKH